jgi:DNA-binding protein HU-beta
MPDRIDRDEFVARVAERTGNSPTTVGKIVDAALEVIYESIKRGEGFTLKNFGSFYVRREQTSWVFKFNPSQRLRKVFGWSSTHKGEV